MKRSKVVTAVAAIFVGIVLSMGASSAAFAGSDKYKPFPPKCTHVESADPTSKCIVLY